MSLSLGKLSDNGYYCFFSKFWVFGLFSLVVLSASSGETTNMQKVQKLPTTLVNCLLCPTILGVSW